MNALNTEIKLFKYHIMKRRLHSTGVSKEDFLLRNQQELLENDSAKLYLMKSQQKEVMQEARLQTEIFKSISASLQGLNK